MATLNEAVALIEKYSKEGDIINIDGCSSNPASEIAYWSIRKAQKELFGKQNKWRDTHTMVKFNNSSIVKYISTNEKVKKILGNNEKPWHKTFSVEPPKTTLITTESFAMDKISIYRYTKKQITQDDIKILLEATIPILLTKYDVGQLIDIAINQILGYPYDEKIYWFDFGTKYKVCSVGAGAIYQKWRKILEAKGTIIPRLFSKLNPNRWSQDFIQKFKDNGGRWNIENYYPALFSNSDMFDNEFKLIVSMNKGKIITLNQ